MKKIIFLLCSCILLASCTSHKQTIRSKDLQGKYEVDFSPLLSGVSDEDDSFETAIAALLLASMKMTMQFEDNTLIVDGTGTAMNLLNMFAEESVFPCAVDYEIRNDSVLYTRTGKDNFQKAGILRKMGESFDYLQFAVTGNDGKDTEILTLRKVSE